MCIYINHTSRTHHEDALFLALTIDRNLIVHHHIHPIDLQLTLLFLCLQSSSLLSSSLSISSLLSLSLLHLCFFFLLIIVLIFFFFLASSKYAQIFRPS